MPTLLAVDLGLRTGLALFGPEGRLAWHRSQHFGSLAALRRGAHGLLDTLPDLAHLVLEGGGPIAEIWLREAAHRHVAARQIAAEQWRAAFFRPVEQANRTRSKRSAEALARRVITWSGLSQPKALRHDAAEAILIGLWGVCEVGWIPSGPAPGP